MSFLRRIERALRAPVLMVCVASCIDQGELFGPGPVVGEDAPRVRLVEPSYVLYAGDAVTVRLQGWDSTIGGSVELFVLDTDREVLWRSTRVPAADSMVRVPVTGVPSALFAAEQLLLTAALELQDARLYATDDSIAVFSRDSAAVRPVRFYPGEVVALASGSPESFAFDPGTGRLFFAAGDRAQIGVIDLSEGRELQRLDVPTGPIALRFSAGVLGALMAEGTELAVFDARAALVPMTRVLLPTLRLEVQTAEPGDTDGGEVDTLLAAVRPYARGIAWSCPDAACKTAVAFSASAVSAAEGPEGRGVLRRVPVGGGAITPLLIPRFQQGIIPADTVGSRVRVWTAAGSGLDSLVFDESDRMRCVTLALGAGAFDVAPNGALYATALGECGEGTRILRIDSAASHNPRLNALAQRNLAGEDRIGSVSELRVSPDGRYVLVRTEDGVHLLDLDLRLRGSVQVSGATAVAWVEGSSDSRFAVASEEGVAVYDTDRRVVVTRFPLGPTRESLLVIWRDGAELIAATAPRERAGIVAARVPNP